MCAIRFALRAACLAILALSVTTQAGTPEEQAGSKEAARRSLQSGNGFLNRGLHDLAIEEYRRFLDAFPDDKQSPTARYGLSVAAFRLERYAEAAVQLERLVRQPRFEFAAEVGTILGRCRASLGEHAKAAAAFERVVKKYSEHALADDAAAGLVEALYRAGRYKDAARRSRLVGEHWPESPLRSRIDYYGGLAEMAGGNYQAAADRLLKLADGAADDEYAQRSQLLAGQCLHQLNRPADAARYYRRVIARGDATDTPQALLGLATIIHNSGDGAEAAKLMDRLLGEFADADVAHSARLLRARIYWDAGQNAEAMTLLDRVAQESLALADQAAYWQAKCRLRERDFVEAADRLDRAIAKYPDSILAAEMHYDRGVALVRGETLEAAVSALKDYLDRFTNHALADDAQHLLAATLHRLGDFGQSLDACSEYLGRFPKGGHVAAVRFLAAENDFLRNRLEDAIKSYQRYLKKHSESEQAGKARYRMGIAMYRLGRTEGAAKQLATAAEVLGDKPAYASMYFALGDISFQKADWEESETYLRRFVNIAPNGDSLKDESPADDDAWLMIGISRMRQSRHKEAIEAFDVIINRFENSEHRLQAMFERGQCLSALNRFAEAKKSFNLVLTQSPGSLFEPHVRNHLGTIALREKQFDVAAGHFDQMAMAMTGKSKEAGDALLFQGQALLSANRFAEAEKVFDNHIDRYGKSARANEARAQRIVALARQDRHEDVLAAVKKLEKRGFDELDDALAAAVLYEKAWCARKLGKTKTAQRSYREILDRHGREQVSVYASADLAGMEMEARRFEAAYGLLQRLMSNTTGVPEGIREQAMYRLGVCLFELKRFDESAVRLEEFLNAFPASTLAASAGYFCGESLYKTNATQRARVHFQRVTERYAADPACPAALLRLGECQASAQEWAKSEETFTRYLDHFADRDLWFQAQFGLGWARENQRRYDDAIKAYKPVVERHQGPTAARAQFQIGECLFARKQYKDAVRELIGVDIHYGYPEWSAAALFEAGRCFEELGQPVEARRQFQEVASRFSESKWAKLAGKRLEVVSAGGLPGR